MSGRYYGSKHGVRFQQRYDTGKSESLLTAPEVAAAYAGMAYRIAASEQHTVRVCGQCKQLFVTSNTYKRVDVCIECDGLLGMRKANNLVLSKLAHHKKKLAAVVAVG